MSTQEGRLSAYPSERPLLTRIPFGYKKKEGDPRLLVYDPVVLLLLEDALDQLDAGISLRVAQEWLNSHTPDYCPKISHQGLKKLRYEYRPNFVRARLKPTIRKLTLEEKQIAKRKNKIAQEKKKVTHALKRKRKLEEEIGIVKENLEGSKPDSSLMLELDYGTEEFKNIEQEVPIVFKPNPGPQTLFFAASEMEVLYGGAAGGEPTSRFYCLLSS